MSISQYLLFLACVALATYAQTMTGFAFGLVLLGLSGVFQLASVSEVANVVSVLSLVNAAVTLARAKPQVNWSLMRPAMASSLVGVGAGVAALAWISGSMGVLLQLLLGCTILGCAVLLIARAQPLSHVSSRGSFVFFGAISGVLGGLFSSAGPPMVYHLYRQPLPLAAIRNSLLILFSLNAIVRLALVTGQGAFMASSFWLSLLALPIVIGVTWVARRYSTAGSMKTVKRMVFVLLLAAGMGLIVPAFKALAAG
ncbi:MULTISPECIES: sulfite exporter TauE/SafE family protein [Achromobacter]|uniref:Probable membrane transporter protein n=1 Tax=Alcaligenes xylosoxydans xylosoxydans TaxID=85698 RepID=A0A424WEV5_ALCXX|nr:MULTISPECIES: sulfite exporter TauE/SafE family protein [Achromobacter]MBC9904537.1 sulfite exporter TauE/SafE family protein [Achromobacter xylosoxidans]MBD0869482.1 sulfite exporter TauE/SafE family protein [Achromobacter xylosoxidans]MDH1304243.1 sulfite exporter TauE/SafE family protein [Achromobacter sp. GD03932]QNP87981.1 sulfite exporter TauE/SafE family protein [Achromobacter xylosoxidans]RPJ91782.1 sulfite exporter TauE/SafE family protein [Achromobacter xylosoxidans]